MDFPRQALPGVTTALALTLACASPQVNVRPNFDFSRIRHVGVLSFPDAAYMPGSGKIASDRLSQYMIESGLSVVERSQLENLLVEQRIGATGAFSRETVQEIGRLIGADAVVMGSLSARINHSRRTTETLPPADLILRYRSGSKTKKVRLKLKQPSLLEIYETEDVSVAVSAKMVIVETGEVLWVVSGNGEKTGLHKALEAALGPGMKRVNKIIRKSLRNKPPAQTRRASPSTPRALP